jgi:hypothetical protein
MWSRFSRLAPSAALLALLFAALAAPVARGDETRLAISGYDPVAYFADGKPVPGVLEFEQVWHDARWRFASAAHRDLFVGNPDRYAPQYDGFCAFGMSIEKGAKYTVDPQAWAIVDGKLYLTGNRDMLGKWRQDVAASIKRGNVNWPTVKETPVKE